MTLYSKLNQIVEQYTDDVVLIQNFVNSTHKTLESFSDVIQEYKGKVTPEDRRNLYEFAKSIQELADEIDEHSPPRWTKTFRATGRVAELVVAATRNMRSKRFFSEMALSYIVSFQEGFVKDYLEEVLSSRPQLLKSNKNLSYQEALGFRSVAGLRRHLAKCETEALGYRSIDDLDAYLQTKFNITMQQEPFWFRVREASYRRNLIIHNRGIINDRYLSKLHIKTNDLRLSADKEYVFEVGTAMIDFMFFMHNSIVKKLKITKRTDSRIESNILLRP